MNVQKKVSRGTRAENLMKNENWSVMKDYIARRIDIITSTITDGTKPEIECGIIIKTSDQVYRECVGELRALKSIGPDFERFIKQKDDIIKKYEDGQH